MSILADIFCVLHGYYIFAVDAQHDALPAAAQSSGGILNDELALWAKLLIRCFF